ncbi:hypothetical protein P0Y35_00380 [Kiritimatiellaeota bacterium B1221]|nr:hypothetical protein [Kiritimatiellaeota bacterium B1221]
MKTYLFTFFSFLVCGLPLKAITVDSWPRHIRIESGIMTVYQPQIDQLDGNILTGRAAVAYKANQNADPVFGAVWIKGTLEIHRSENLVKYIELEITDTRFPDGSEQAGTEFQAAIKEGMKTWELDTTLDALKTSLAASEVAESAETAFEHVPPEIVTRTQAALLVNIDGKTRLSEIEGTTLKSVENTPYPLIFDPAKKTYFLNAAAGVWYSASSEDGPWTFMATPPGELVQLVEAQKPEENQPEASPGITADNAPEIIVAHQPTELVVTEGEAEFQPLIDNLLVIKNSETPVFMEVESQAYFLNLSGRWYQSKSIEGKWTYLESDALPEVFHKIPADSTFADIRAYVAGTDEAREAVMDAQIPQTAAIKRGTAEIDVIYDGKPRFEKVDGTDLTFAVNSSETVIFDKQSYFLVKDGVWYIATAPGGPWQVSDKAPPGIAGVQPSSPVYNTKYVYIYGSTPEVVYVGYTPGYLCSYVVGPTVVYGTGYNYQPWYGPRYYYPRHATWGFSFRYSPVTGWGVGMSWSNGIFRVSWYNGGGWHGRPWYGPGVWGPARYRPSYHSYNNVHINNHLNINRGDINIDRSGFGNNLYDRKDQLAKMKDDFASRPNRPETLPAHTGDRLDKVKNRPQTLPADRDPLGENNLFTDKEGNIFKHENGKWQAHDQGKWKETDLSKPASRPAIDTGNRPQIDKRPPGVPDSAKPQLPSTRPATRPEINKPSLPNTLPSSVSRPATRPSTGSGYNQSHTIQRESYARSRASSAGAARSQRGGGRARAARGR